MDTIATGADVWGGLSQTMAKMDIKSDFTAAASSSGRSDSAAAASSSGRSDSTTATLIGGKSVVIKRGTTHAATEANAAKVAGRVVRLHQDTLAEVRPEEEVTATVTMADGDVLDIDHTTDCTAEFIGRHLSKHFGRPVAVERTAGGFREVQPEEEVKAKVTMADGDVLNIEHTTDCTAEFIGRHLSEHFGRPVAVERTAGGFREVGTGAPSTSHWSSRMTYKDDDSDSDAEDMMVMGKMTAAQFSAEHPMTALKAIVTHADGRVSGVTKIRGTKARLIGGGTLDMSAARRVRTPKGVLHKVRGRPVPVFHHPE